MPYNPATGVYTPPNGAENAFPGQVIASATWNAIFTDISEALTQVGQSILVTATIKTTAGPFTLTTEGLLVLNKAAPSVTSIILPAVATRNLSQLRIIDWAGNAGDITIHPNGSETIEGLATWVLTSGGSAGTGGSITLLPSTDLSGWLVMP